MRTHKTRIEAARAGDTPEQISRNKNSRCKERSAARKHDNLEKIALRPNFSPKTQLERLDNRLGRGIGAKKERERLQKKLG